MFDVMFHRLSKCAMDPFAQFAEPKKTKLALVRVVEKVIFGASKINHVAPGWLVGQALIKFQFFIRTGFNLIHIPVQSHPGH